VFVTIFTALGYIDIYRLLYIMRLLKKRCRILPAGGLGVSPSFKKVPQDWGILGVDLDYFGIL